MRDLIIDCWKRVLIVFIVLLLIGFKLDILGNLEVGGMIRESNVISAFIMFLITAVTLTYSYLMGISILLKKRRDALGES